MFNFAFSSIAIRARARAHTSTHTTTWRTMRQTAQSVQGNHLFLSGGMSEKLIISAHLQTFYVDPADICPALHDISSLYLDFSDNELGCLA